MVNELDDAIKALELAVEFGRAQDLGQYRAAHQGLVNLRNSLLEYDEKLNTAELAPSGDDYNELIRILGVISH